MASPQTDSAHVSQASKDAQTLIDQTSKGLNADCIFQTWSNDRQMQAYRELNKVQDPSDSIPDLTLSYSDAGKHLVKRGDNSQLPGACAPVNDTTANRNAIEAPRQRAPRAAETWKPYESYQLQPRDTPEARAEKIEDLATLALRGDERSRLDLRKALERLSTAPKDFQEKVLAKMADDGSYMTINPFNGKPHVTFTTGANGKIENVTFSRYAGVDKQEIPMNKSVDQQVEEAQKGYVSGLRSITGGLGKFDPNGTMKAYELLEGGQEPGTLRWFHLYRKDQGKPAIDQDKLQGN